MTLVDKRLSIATAALPGWDAQDPGACLVDEETAAARLRSKGIPESKHTLKREREGGGRYRYTRLKGRFVRYFDHEDDAKSPLIQAGLLGLQAFTSTAEEEAEQAAWSREEERKFHARTKA